MSLVLPTTTPAAVTRDFTTWDAFLDDIALIYYEGEGARKTTATVPLRPVRQDVGNNPSETRPESGDIFGQSDFTHGSGQTLFHVPNRDASKYLYAEGFNIETVGKLQHLHEIIQESDITDGGSLEVAGTAIYAADGTNVKRSTDLTTWTTEDPSGPEAPNTVLSLAASGDDLFAALGPGGLHYRPGSTGTWAHYQPDGESDLLLGGMFRDTFDREVDGSWGTSDSGSVWSSLFNGSGDLRSVSGGKGHITEDTAGQGNRQYVDGEEYQDFDMVTFVSTNKLATGGYQNPHWFFRWQDGNNNYGFALRFNTDQSIDGRFFKVISGVTTDIRAATDVGITHVVSKTLGVRVRAEGTSFSFRVWDSAIPEPESWTFTDTDSDITDAGEFHIGVALESGTSNAPVQFSYESIEIDDLDVDEEEVTLCRWIRGRPFVVGDDVNVYEITTSSTPSKIGDTLTDGYEFTDMFQAGQFIYGCAVNEDASRSFLRIFSLKEDLSGFEWKGDSPMPRGQLIYAGVEELGKLWLAGGKLTHDGGYDPVVYQAVQDEAGFVHLEAKLAEGKDSGSGNLSSKAITSLGEAIIFGWSLATASTFGAREGMGIYYPGRAAFANHHVWTNSGTTRPLLSIVPFMGHHVWTTSDGLFYEDMDDLVADATMYTSIADWNNAGLKTWSKITLYCKPLPAGTTIDVYYTIKHPEEDDWTLAGTVTGLNVEGDDFDLTNVVSRVFALKFVSHAKADQSVAPEITGYSVRSDPALEAGSSEWRLVRYVQVNAKDSTSRKGRRVFTPNPGEFVNDIRDKHLQWVNLYEPNGSTWRLRLEEIQEVQPFVAIHQTRDGDPDKDSFVLALTFQGTRE